MPAASRMPARIENADACSPLNSSAMAAPPPSASTPDSPRTQPTRPCSTATSRSASAGRTLPARRAAATTASCAMPTPIPSAATSGIHECPGSKPAGMWPWPREQVDERGGERPPGQQPERAGHERDEQRLGRDQAADLARRGAERAQHRGLLAPLGDRERERPGDHEQRDEAGDAAHRAEDRDHRLAVGRLRVARVGVGRVGVVEHLDARARRSPASEAPGLAMIPTALTRPGAPESVSAVRAGEEHRGLAAVPVGGAAGDAGDAVRALAARRGDVDGGAERARAGASRRRRRAGRTGRGRRSGGRA